MPSPINHGEPFAFMTRMQTPDGMGGFKEEYVQGEEFQALLFKNNSTEIQIAEKNGVAAFYTFQYSKDIQANYHDVFKRLSDGDTFRITSYPEDMTTPKKSKMYFISVSAERYTLA